MGTFYIQSSLGKALYRRFYFLQVTIHTYRSTTKYLRQLQRLDKILCNKGIYRNVNNCYNIYIIQKSKVFAICMWRKMFVFHSIAFKGDRHYLNKPLSISIRKKTYKNHLKISFLLKNLYIILI